MNFWIIQLYVTSGLFIAQTKLRMLVSRDVLTIHRAYAEWAWHLLGFTVFAESIICGLSFLWGLLRFGNRLPNMQHSQTVSFMLPTGE